MIAARGEPGLQRARTARRLAGCALALWLAAAPDARAQDTVFIGAKIYTGTGTTIDKGMIVVRRGKIASISSVGARAAPPGATVVDVTGKVIIPGLVDTHSHIGVYSRPNVPANADGDDPSKPIQADLRALDAINPDDPGIRMAQAGGVTTVNIMPGSGDPVGGQTAYVKLRGDTVDEMLILPVGVQGGMKMAGGENPKTTHGARKKQGPATRMGIAALQRELFIRAREYQEKTSGVLSSAKKPERDLALEAMVEVLERKRTVHYHCHRADDIMTALRLQDEFGFDLVLQHGTEAWLVAGEIAKRNVPVSIIVADSPGGKLEASRLRLDNGALLERAGVRVAIHSDDPINPSRLFLRLPALAVRGGMSENAALAAVTLEAAKILGLDSRIGSLAPGKDADLVVLSGPPFSVYTQVLQTWIEGELVFDRADPEQRRYATGGFAVGDRYPELEARP